MATISEMKMAELPDCRCADDAFNFCDRHSSVPVVGHFEQYSNLVTALRDLLSIVDDKEFRYPDQQAVLFRARRALKAAGG